MTFKNKEEEKRDKGGPFQIWSYQVTKLLLTQMQFFLWKKKNDFYLSSLLNNLERWDPYESEMT